MLFILTVCPLFYVQNVNVCDKICDLSGHKGKVAYIYSWQWVLNTCWRSIVWQQLLTWGVHLAGNIFSSWRLVSWAFRSTFKYHTLFFYIFFGSKYTVLIFFKYLSYSAEWQSYFLLPTCVSLLRLFCIITNTLLDCSGRHDDLYSSVFTPLLDAACRIQGGE